MLSDQKSYIEAAIKRNWRLGIRRR